MKSTVWKSTFREIRQSLGRYLAIMAIVALGVGFFAGLKATQPAMLQTTQNFYNKKNFYDYRLLSTLGFEQEDVEVFRDKEGVKAAEGALQFDILCDSTGGNTLVLKAHSITEEVNQLMVLEGRMPEKPDECVVDANLYDESWIGKKITLSETNAKEDLEHFAYKEYVITGTVRSPLYIQFERGTTALGSGTISGFLYLLGEGFAEDYYTEIYVAFDHDFAIYSEEYGDFIAKRQDDWEVSSLAAVRKRYMTSLTEFSAQMADAEQKIADGEKALSELKEPETYVLGRDTNVGYVCFENDSAIVDGIANVFPLFFFLVAALVCVTTMNRMVEEQRTQIGVLKALGYSERTIMSKYMFYSGSAAVLGCLLGFFGGTVLFPQVIWFAYGIMYKVDSLVYLLDWKIALVSLAASLACSVGTTWLSCRYELTQVAAQLMRPKAPKAGKRVILERIPFIWKRLKFLQKVSVRNILRYKKRFFMMILGISGCTALLVTGFGVRDSVKDVTNQQFTEIHTYDLSVAYSEPVNEATEQELLALTAEGVDVYGFALEVAVDLQTDKGTKGITMVVSDPKTDITPFVNLHTTDQEPIEYPETGKAVISHKIASQHNIRVGDTITLWDEEMRTIEVEIGGIFQNFVSGYVYISADTYELQLGETPAYKTAYVNIPEDADGHCISTEIMNLADVVSVNVVEDTMNRFSGMMRSLDLIVLVIILCAAGLAFIVLYNLTNINITERIREIATIKVLGFYERESATYVFRENNILAFLGAMVGLVLGYFLHQFVMSQINVDIVAFDVHIKLASYVYSVIMTLLFAFLVNRVMKKKIDRVSMTESLKSVD